MRGSWLGFLAGLVVAAVFYEVAYRMNVPRWTGKPTEIVRIPGSRPPQPVLFVDRPLSEEERKTMQENWRRGFIGPRG